MNDPPEGPGVRIGRLRTERRKLPRVETRLAPPHAVREEVVVRSTDERREDD